MEIIAAVTSTEAVTRILEHIGLPSTPPAFHSARPPPQTELPFATGVFGTDPPANGFEPDPPAPDDFGALHGSLPDHPNARSRVGKVPVRPDADTVLVFPAREGSVGDTEGAHGGGLRLS